MYEESTPGSVMETENRVFEILEHAEEAGHIRRLTVSMPDRLRSLIEAKGGPTRY